MVYGIAPDASGAITGSSEVQLVLGDGRGAQITPPGEVQPALAFAINQPLQLSMTEDQRVLVMNAYGVASFDPQAREAETLFLDNKNDEITPSLAGFSSINPAAPASFVAVTGTSLFSRTYVDGMVRVDVDRLSSELDPTRTIARVGSAYELTDTTMGMVWRFDAQTGRLLEQKKRTGETDFTVSYRDARSEAIDRITNAVGGQWVFGYTNGKISSITDPAGAQTTIHVSSLGDLTSFVEPDGESHTFVYDAHHMTSKTTARGDTTTYEYADDGTVSASHKPGGENYAFDRVNVVGATYDPTGHPERLGGYTDARGVHHDLKLDAWGRIERETFIADGVTRTKQAVYADQLLAQGEESVAGRVNAMKRASHSTLNGVNLSPPFSFDSFGRPFRQKRTADGSELVRQWAYQPDGWLALTYDGPANLAQRIDRDAAGHVIKIADVRADDLAPTGRETTFTWRTDGQPATMTSHGVTTQFNYDDAGSRNLASTLDSLGRQVFLGYDARGNVTSTSDTTASATFVFDANNRLLESRDGNSNSTTLRYTHAGCGCSESDLVTGVHTPDLPAGVEWTMAYGAQGRLASVTDPHGFTESYTYEPTGEVKTIQDRLNRTTTMTHDQLGRVLSIVDTLGRKHARSYTVPTASGWSGPTLTGASADGTAASTDLSAPLRSGDYQIGLNAHAIEGWPAQISFYRDATFALGYTSLFDAGQRLTYRADRTSRSIDSAVVARDAGTVAQETVVYEVRTSAPLMTILESPRSSSGGVNSSSFTRNLEYDLVDAGGLGGGSDPAARYFYARDAGGRVTSRAHHFSTAVLAGEPVVGVTGVSFDALASNYVYRSDGRISSIANADGAAGTSTLTLFNGARSVSLSPGGHQLTFDARGLVATQTDFDGVYRYSYDEVGRNTRLEFPDGHARVHVFDDLGRITSRCYRYATPSLDRCYSAQYDAVGNPTRLVDPEGSDELEYDALDRLTKLTRKNGSGAVVSVEDYAYNGLGALRVHAGATVDHQRPRLGGGGSADAAVPATFRGSAVNLDAGGRITLLDGSAFDWDLHGQQRRIDPPTPLAPAYFGFDPMGRRAWTLGGTSLHGRDFYMYEGVDRIALVDPTAEFPNGEPQLGFLFDGVDHPLRVSGSEITTSPQPPPPASPTQILTELKPAIIAYYELDLAGNVRRLRARDGTDLGGYRYSAFGRMLEDTVAANPGATTTMSAPQPPLRWKGMWRFQVGSGASAIELYDARARVWSPDVGIFLSIDELAFHDARSSLWGWPAQSPSRFGDPFGRGLRPPPGGMEVGIFRPGTDRDVLAESAQLNFESGRAWDEGNYLTAAIKLWASAGAFYASQVTIPLLTRRPVTSAEMAMMACPIEGPGGIGAGAGERAVAAADLGIPNAALTELRGSVTNAGSTRIIQVDMVKGAIAPAELRGALGNVVNAARADGVQTLQIQGTFGNERLQSFVGRQAAELGGTVSSTGGTDTITFVLGP